jgi:hypothetical protein
VSLEIVTPPRSSALVSLADVKTLLRPDDDSLDPMLTILIAAVSSSIQDVVLGFQLGRHRVVESLSGQPRTHVVFTNIPIDPESMVVTIDDLPDNPYADFTLNSELGIAYRQNGWGGTVYPSWWIGSNGWSTGNQRVVGESTVENVHGDYYGGYLLPNDVSDWVAATPYAKGAFVRLAAPSVFRLECTTAGTSGSSAPAYPSAAGGTVVDGSTGGVTWTARTAWELPACFIGWAFAEIIRRAGRLRVSSDVWTMDQEGNRTTFSPVQMAKELAPNVLDGILAWRQGRGGIA